ncbi:MAG: oligosaccharide flippase family protein [Candidatus Krumholzibacteria bacterium]|jgi:O-antigen/teichoic acid export membrane protein|nr:oligosaccharide flippase family protein [Candidatus Krumholzibacteria bacterium]MDP6668453.1 oligosaccharide flippase family protein [Candidatus Krumholzibacteria bacterium]MDP7021546.1 oligosaccharide flippase family protein [Candidatus Krumholzibacteria bacterium]
MLQDTIYVFLGTYGSQFLSLFISIVLARKLSTENYGVYSVVLATYMQGTMILSLGIQPIVQRYLPEFLGTKNRSAVLKIQWLGALSHVFTGALLVYLCWLFRDALSSWLNIPQFISLLPFFLFFTIFKVEANILEEMLTAHRAQKYRNFVLVGFQALKLFLFLWFLPEEGPIPRAGTLERLFTFLAISNLALMLAFLARILGLSRNLEDESAEQVQYKRLFRFGLLQYASSLTLIALYKDIDTWIISHFQGVEEAGVYRFATSAVTALVTLVPMHLLLRVIIPVYVKEYTERKDKNQLVKVFRFYNKVVTSFIVPLLIGALLLATPIISIIFDPKWLPAVLPFRIYFLAMFMTHYLNTMSFLPLILEKPEITLFSRIFLIYNIILDFILIPMEGPFGGAVGAALATGSALVFGYLLSYTILKRHIAVRFPWMANLKVLIYGTVMGVAVWLLLERVEGILSLLGVVALGALVYLFLAWRFPVFNTEERERFNIALGRKIFRT